MELILGKFEIKSSKKECMETLKYYSQSFTLDEFANLLNYLFNSFFTMFEIFSSINDENFLIVFFAYPVLMFVMNHLQVFDWDLCLLLSLPDLNSIVAYFGTTSQINNFGFIYQRHSLEVLIN